MSTETDLGGTRRRLWILLWLAAIVWLLSTFAVLWMIVTIGFQSARFGLWVYGAVTLGCLVAGFRVNNRFTAIESARRSGRCWRCDVQLDESNADRCPECGARSETPSPGGRP